MTEKRSHKCDECIRLELQVSELLFKIERHKSTIIEIEKKLEESNNLLGDAEHHRDLACNGLLSAKVAIENIILDQPHLSPFGVEPFILRN